MAIRADDIDLRRDQDLVLRHQAGDPGAFDELYRAHHARLVSFCQRRVGDRHVAEEIAQEAFVRALRAMPALAGERRFYPWMTVIARRLCADHHRARSRIEVRAVIDPGSVGPDHDRLEADVDRSHLRAAFEQLPTGHRQVLTLREQHELSYQQIAMELDVSVSSVEARLHRARRALRRAFLAVSDNDNNVLALPLLGLAARFQGWRARWGDRLSEATAYVAPAAAAATVTAAVLLAPAEPADTTTVEAAEAPVAAPTTATAPPAPTGTTATTSTEPASQPPPTTEAAAKEPALPPADHQVGPVRVYTDPAKKAEVREVAEEMPVFGELGSVFLGVDLPQLIDEAVVAPTQALVDSLLGGPE